MREEIRSVSPIHLISDHLDLSPAAQVAPNITRLVAYSPGKPVEEVERELGITGIIKLASTSTVV